MPVAISILLSLLCGIVAFVGHLTVCIWLKNTVHAFGIPRIFIKLYDLCLYTWGLLPLVAVGWYLYDAYAGAGEIQLSWLLSVYIAFCFFIAVGPLPWCYWLRWRIPKAAALRSEQSQLIDLRPQLGRMTDQNWLGRACCVLPGNEALWLDCNARELEIPR